MKLSALFSPDGLQFVQSADVVLSAGHCSRWKRDRVLSDEDDDVDVRMKGGKKVNEKHVDAHTARPTSHWPWRAVGLRDRWWRGARSGLKLLSE